MFIESGIAALRADGARVTKSRKAVLEVLAAASTPITARELFSKFEKDGLSIDQVTVYRILEAFEELDLIHRVYPSGGFLACFHQGCCRSLHLMTHCTSCEVTAETHVPENSMKGLVEFLSKELEFEIVGHVLQVNGLCSKCR